MAMTSWSRSYTRVGAEEARGRACRTADWHDILQEGDSDHRLLACGRRRLHVPAPHLCIQGRPSISDGGHPYSAEFLLKVSLTKLVRDGIRKLIPDPLISNSRRGKPTPGISRIDRSEVHDLV